MKIEVVPALPEHVEPIASRMRPADVAEIWASSKQRPHLSLRICMCLTPDAKTILLDGMPIAMFGIHRNSALSNKGVPWMMTTPELETISYRFLKGSRAVFKGMMAPFTTVENYVDVRNTVAIRWLKWLGFVILDPEPYGHLQIPFHKFYLEKESCAI